MIAFIVFSIAGCNSMPEISEEYVSETPAFDVSTINIGDKSCDFETLIRDKFPSYRIHRKSETVLYFFDFKKCYSDQR